MTTPKVRGNEGPDTRPARIVRALAQSPAPLSAPDLVRQLAEGIPDHRQALSWYGFILRRFEHSGRVTRAGTGTGAYHNVPTVRWAVTDAGRAWLKFVDEAPARAEAERAEKARAAQAATERAAKLELAAVFYGRPTPRATRIRVARELKDAGCTAVEIGRVFGVSREMIRLDLLGRAGGRS